MYACMGNVLSGYLHGFGWSLAFVSGSENWLGEQKARSPDASNVEASKTGRPEQKRGRPQ